MSTQCVSTINYAEVASTPRIPFTFSLNLDASVLEPAPGQYQRFCYDITGVGADVPTDADLSHFVLGVCSQLTQEDLVSAQVFINGVEQEVELGENVEVLAEDPTTGCAGIKFDFGLDKVDGVMNVCFELARTFGVGPVLVCVKGGQATLSSLMICGAVCASPESCATVVSQRANVCVPVTITPYATVGRITSQCCGTPVITAGAVGCAGSLSCTFTIAQELCINVPVAFGASGVAGTARTNCGTPAQGECDCAT